VNAASSNNRMLQVIFFALLFGIAALSLDREKTAPVIKLFNSLYDIILKMVDFIILFTPYGVFALMTTLVVDFSGNLSVFGALAVYAGTVIFALLTLIFFSIRRWYTCSAGFGLCSFLKISTRFSYWRLLPVPARLHSR